MTQADEAIERLRADVDRSDNDDLSYVCSQQYETDIRTLLAEVGRLRAAIEPFRGLRKLIRRMHDIITDIADNIEEGDGSRSYFGSTNDADELKELARELHDLRMAEAMTTDKPVELKPGWLAEDVAKATARVAEWTKPAPAMTAERLAQLRAICDDEWGREIFAHIDALDAALKEAEEKFQCELRRANDYQDSLHRVGDQAKDLYARALAVEAQLKEARGKVLEEAAALVETLPVVCTAGQAVYITRRDSEIAAAVRSLKDKTP